MKERKIMLGLGLLMLPPWLLPLAMAASFRVDCDAGATIAGVLTVLKPGDSALVTGACKGNLLIPEEVQKITLDGQGKATIQGQETAKDTILIQGRGITIKGFTITGGRDGIMVVGGGTAVIDGNAIQNTGRFGVYVTQHSSARIINNTIQTSAQFGISISGNSFAYIGLLGFLDLTDKVASPNTIRSNGRAGVHVHRTSYARIAGNTISNNKLHGIEVTGVSHAQIGSNTISANGADGILVSQNSGVDLGSDTRSEERRVGKECRL